MANPNDNWIETHLGAIAHDLRGPLSVVSGHAQVLRRLADGQAPAERVRASAEAILRAISRMAAVLDELSRESREPGAQVPLDTVEVGDLLDGALRGSRSRQVQLEVAPDLPAVAVERHAFEHRAAVLLSALRTGRGDEPIILRVERRGDVVRFSLPEAWIELPVA